MTTTDDSLQDSMAKLLQETEKYLERNDISMIYECYRMSILEIGKTPSLTGVYINQSLATALDLARLRLHPTFIGSIILYYPVFANVVSVRRVATEINDAVAIILQKLIDVGRLIERYLPWPSPEELKQMEGKKRASNPIKPHWDVRTLENSPKLLLKIAGSPEIAAVKLADRLNLLRKAKLLIDDQGQIQKLAYETLHVHALIAEELGIWSLKWKLDDEAFKILEPKAFQEIVSDLNQRRADRERVIAHAIELLSKALTIEGLRAEVKGRPKHIYGLYLKMKSSHQSAKEVNDNLAVRILVETKADCYHALTTVLRTLPPAQGIYGKSAFRDWIENPKPNGYQSIHTTVLLKDKTERLLEVQIRTFQMNEVAEYGLASHWVYRKAGGSTILQGKNAKHAEEIAAIRRGFEDRNRK